jgi:hypothetical protein
MIPNTSISYLQYYQIENNTIQSTQHWIIFSSNLTEFRNWTKLTKRSSPAMRHDGAWGERRYNSYSFLTSALDGGEWSASRPEQSWQHLANCHQRRKNLLCARFLCLGFSSFSLMFNNVNQCFGNKPCRISKVLQRFDKHCSCCLQVRCMGGGKRCISCNGLQPKNITQWGRDRELCIVKELHMSVRHHKNIFWKIRYTGSPVLERSSPTHLPAMQPVLGRPIWSIWAVSQLGRFFQRSRSLIVLS